MNSTFDPWSPTQPLPAALRRRRQMRSRHKRHPRLRRLMRVSALTALIGVLLAVVAGYAYLQSLPSVSDAQQRVDTILREHHGVGVATPPPQNVGQAVVAVEDQRFYSNHGIDTLSMLHFAWGYLTTGSTSQGGATISEQLVKRLYVRQPTTLAGKIEMLGLALKLDQSYAKPQILEMYLNAIYYGDQAYGIEQASQIYFHTSADQLTWGEASLLAGLPQAPSSYDPLKHYDLARERQRHVLSRLVATGVLTPAQAAAAYAETPRLP